ncbi:transporter substrate-binding domain-containing protein [Paraglaciecola sp. 20A4]|uniref:substrate-binding periplasmic protein n=1 Tax=Paraglaciecola sp. 20A4 TaxID=2687288 RepID=UPI001F0DF79E|nr:transporter substrate-binding domain-containing protein [Paraglaciecola sp. 20A4]
MLFRNLIFSLLLSGLVHQQAMAASEHKALVVAVIFAEGLPFYEVDNKTQQTSGLFNDILLKLAQTLQVDLQFSPTARNKIEQDIISAKADVGFLAPKWLNAPESMLFSDPVLTYQHAFYGLVAPQKKESLSAQVKGKTVCLRENYSYPELDAWLEKGELTPVRVSRETRLFDMLQLSRCDLVYTNTLRAQWTISSHDFDKSIYQLGTLGGVDQIPLAFSLSWLSRMPEINAAIADMRHSGELKRIVDKNLAVKYAKR